MERKYLQQVLLAVGSCLAVCSLGGMTMNANAIDNTELLQPVMIKENELLPTGHTVLPGETTEEGWYEGTSGTLYYCYADGSYATGVTTLSTGETYLFALDGALKTGWQTVDGLRFYFNRTTGQKEFGWVTHSNRLYYVFEETGKQVGETEIDGTPYIFDEYGVLQTGIYTCSDGTVAGCQTDATPYSGWVTDSETGNSYYFNASGIAQTGLQTIDGAVYFFNTSGVMQTGLFRLEDGSVRYFGTDGKQVTGLQTISGKTYYLTETGFLTNQLYTTNNATYYFDTNGVMQTGLVTLPDGSTRYFGTDGKQVTGLQILDNKSYYFTTAGMLKSQKLTLDGVTYYFGADGSMQSGIVAMADGSYYFGTTGAMETGWITWDGVQYYFDPETGKMVTGTVTLSDGITYIFGEDGVYQGTEITETDAISYDVPYYNQADPTWGSTYIGTKTIAQVGCLVTSLAMTESYFTGSEILPDAMRNELQFSNNSLLWASVYAKNYTIESCSGLSETAFLQRLYELLGTGPVIVGCDNVYGGSHYVVVTGCTNSDTGTLQASDFTINDPGYSSRTTLAEHLSGYPTWFHFYYKNS